MGHTPLPYSITWSTVPKHTSSTNCYSTQTRTKKGIGRTLSQATKKILHRRRKQCFTPNKHKLWAYRGKRLIKFPAENPFIQMYSKYEHMYQTLLLKTFLNNLREIDCRHKVLNLKNTTIIPLSCCLLDGSFNFLIALKNAVYSETEITSWIYNFVQKN